VVRVRRYARGVPHWAKGRLLGGEQLVGSFLQLPSLSSAEALARSRWFDFLCVEGEHSSLGLTDVASLVRVVDLAGLPCLVRAGDGDFAAIATGLDAGASGVIVPRVESRAEAEHAVFAAHFPPDGGRGVGPGRASMFGADIDAYVEAARKQTLVCVQVESRAGVEHLEEIASTLVDLVFVGPRDLALSYALDPLRDASALRELAAGVLARSRELGKLTGIYCGGADEARSWLAAGVSIVIVGSDLAFLSVGATQALAGIRDH
jgi:4-hydroxy-2-oxoheptanedioate aldolase